MYDKIDNKAQIESEVKKISEIARLNLTEEEIKEFSRDLVSILESFSIINRVNTENIKPTFRPIEVINKYREDKIKESLNRIEVMKNIKNKEDFYYKGPKTL